MPKGHYNRLTMKPYRDHCCICGELKEPKELKVFPFMNDFVCISCYYNS